jgi:hypothetical protein
MLKALNQAFDAAVVNPTGKRRIQKGTRRIKALWKSANPADVRSPLAL